MVLTYLKAIVILMRHAHCRLGGQSLSSHFVEKSKWWNVSANACPKAVSDISCASATASDPCPFCSSKVTVAVSEYQDPALVSRISVTV
jgi:hypothetical protein